MVADTPFDLDRLPRAPHVLIVAGMSGAGKSTAGDVLEDTGYTVIDNLPPELLAGAVEYTSVTEDQRRLAVVIGARASDTLETLQQVVQELGRSGIRTAVLFLDADDDAIIRRYEENRRPHPLGGASIHEAIAAERRLLERVKESADVVIDTTDLNVHQLRRRITGEFSDEAMERPMRVSIHSFGFKHGSPRDADLLFDVRFLPNPHWEPDLRPLRGTDGAVSDYVLGSEDAKEFIERIDDLVSFLVPRYQAEGKSYVSIGIGCTGGHHRSVAIAEELGRRLEQRGIQAAVRHRDVDE